MSKRIGAFSGDEDASISPAVVLITCWVRVCTGEACSRSRTACGNTPLSAITSTRPPMKNAAAPEAGTTATSPWPPRSLIALTLGNPRRIRLVRLMAGVAVRVRVLVKPGLAVALAAAVAVSEAVEVGVAPAVGESVGVPLAVGLAVTVAVLVTVAVWLCVGAGVGVPVSVAVPVGVGLAAVSVLVGGGG